MKTQQIKPTKTHARKIVELLSHGLTGGLGSPEPGKMCVEAAVCYAFGLPHGDKPPCVGPAVRSFKITLNDCRWSSDEARARGMRKLAIAQLGSDALDQMKFGKLCFLRGVQTLMPIVFRKVATDPKVKPEHKAKFLEIADTCEKVTTFEEARKVADDAYAYAYAYASAYAYALRRAGSTSCSQAAAASS